MKKRVFSAVLVLSMLLAMLPVTVHAAVDVSDLSGLQSHMDADNKLLDDIILTSAISFRNNFTLDLNGHSITQTHATMVALAVEGACTLTLRDSVGSGVITGCNGSAVIIADTDGEFIMYGGTISGNQSTSNGGGVEILLGTFTMNGGTISNNTANSGGGVYVDTNGTFVMNGGTISDNTSNASGGGVYVQSNGTFTMNGGEISGNHSKTSTTSGGGGVYVFSNGSFAMNGGTISSNISDFSGGGVYIDNGAFHMTNGTISSNTAANKGGGVYQLGTFSVSGNTSITGNKAGTTASDVHLPSSNKTVSISASLGANAKIGVTADSPADGLVIATGADSGDAAKFQSNNTDYAVTDGTTAGQLVLTSSGSLTINNVVNGADASGQTYTFTLTGPNSYSQTFTITGADSQTITGLLPGTYHLSASPVNISGYTLTMVNGETDPEIIANTETIITVTHTYNSTTSATEPDRPSDEPEEPLLELVLTPSEVTIPNGTVDPTLTVTSSIAFASSAADTSKYALSENSTGLRISRVTQNSDTSVTIHFEGTARQGSAYLEFAADNFVDWESIDIMSLVTITVPAPSSSGSSSGGGGSTPTPPVKTPEIPETVPSPVQEDILKDGEEKHPDWVDRLELPDYAKTLYNVMSGRPIQSGVTNSPERESVFQPEENFDLGQQGVPGSADVEFVEEVNFDLRDMYAPENEEMDETGKKEVRSTIFEDEKFYTVSVSDADKRVNYSALQQGDVIRTAKFNGLFVTKIVRDATYDTAKKEACEYVAAVYQAFDRDCPEIFWLSGKCKVRIMTVKSGGGQEAYFFLVLADDSGFTMRSPEWEAGGAITTGVQRRNEAITKILETVTSGEVVEQVKQLNQWLTENNQYNTTPDLTTISNEPHECLSALEGRIDQNGPVCDGYSRAFKVLCDRLDIPCVLETGWAQATATSTPEFHMWCNVQIGETWYGVDVTWDDPSVKGFVGAKSGQENENFLLVGANTVVLGREFQASHIVKNQACVGGVDFNNGPVLSPIAFAPVAYSGGYYVALFDDVPVTHWAAEAVAWAKSMGYMAGTSGVTFSPDSLVTREQVWIVLARVAGEPFTSREGIRQWAVNAGITDGSDPQAPASRQQALTFLYLCAKLKGYPLTQSAGLSSYLDASQVAPWAEEAMGWAVGSGLVSGTTPTTLSPEGAATRAQFALILQNFFKNVHAER